MGGACVIGSTKVLLPDGRTVTIKQLVEEEKEKNIVSIDMNTLELTTANIADYVDSGMQETIKFVLNSGRSIQGTIDHPVIVKNKYKMEWTRLKDLTVGMRVAVPKALPYFGTNHEQYARLIGMLIGDGSYGKSHIKYNNVAYGSKDEELWDYINECKDIDIHFNTKTFITKDNMTYRTANLYGITQILNNAGIMGQSKSDKTLPINWETYDKESLAELIGGLFDTDGNVYIEDNRKPVISFSNICKPIIDELQIALLRYGIHSCIQSRINNGKQSFGPDDSIYYVLHIRGKENIENFYNNVKLLVQYKQDNLDKAMKVLSSHKMKIQANLINTDLRFERIVSIEHTGKQHVYDLTVDTHHNFISNGIISHNTNAKMIKIGTPKTRNHFFESMEGKGSEEWFNVRRDWTQCPQLWALDAIMLPDHNDPTHTKLRPYSRYVFGLMPKSLKQWYFPTRPDVWSEGQMSVEDFKTQYMLEFVDGAGAFLTNEERGKLSDGDFDWLLHGKYGEQYVAGIDFAGSSAASADFTHITVLRIDETTNQKQKVYSEEMQGVSYPEQIRRIALLFGGYHPIFQCSSIFADFTGCGRPVVQTLIEEFGLTQLTGITFNASDTFTHSGMNLKNAMYANMKQEIDYDRFKYPNLDKFLASAGTDKNGFYHKMIGEWADLECEQKLSVNKRIEAPAGGHDDVPSADVLANFAATTGKRKTIAAPIIGHFYGGLK